MSNFGLNYSVRTATNIDPIGILNSSQSTFQFSKEQYLEHKEIICLSQHPASLGFRLVPGHVTSSLQSYHCMHFDCGRKPDYSESTHTNTERTCQRHNTSCCEVTVLTTAHNFLLFCLFICILKCRLLTLIQVAS